MPDRRPVSSRGNGLIRSAARLLCNTRVTPNMVSAFSVVASLLVPIGLLLSSGWLGVSLAVLGIQLRLLANVLDGLVAVEGGKGSPIGALYNEFPDRLADTIILVSMGYAAGADWLGWAAALTAALTAYVRVFGGALGQPQSFQGPMAKQHRMALATVALIGAQAAAVWQPGWYAVVLQGALAVIVVGSAITCATRTRTIVRHFDAQGAQS